MGNKGTNRAVTRPQASTVFASGLGPAEPELEPEPEPEPQPLRRALSRPLSAAGDIPAVATDGAGGARLLATAPRRFRFRRPAHPAAPLRARRAPRPRLRRQLPGGLRAGARCPLRRVCPAEGLGAAARSGRGRAAAPSRRRGQRAGGARGRPALRKARAGGGGAPAGTLPSARCGAGRCRALRRDWKMVREAARWLPERRGRSGARHAACPRGARG